VFRLTQKTLFFIVRFIAPLVILSAFLPFFRPCVMAILRGPLYLCDLLGREISGIVFYHRNYIERDTLKRRIDYLNNRLAAVAETSIENTRLTNLLSFKQQLPYNVIAGRVIGRDPSNWSSTVIINKGRSSGIRKGAAAVTFLGLAGRVMDVQETTSTVTLINDPSVSVSARVQRSRQEGLACGSLGGTLLLKLLPKDCDVIVGDTVVTSGLTSVYPKGLLVGSVSAIARDFSGLSMYAVIKPSVELANLEEILVIVE
jgi:rod shape-determining protein MreC